MTPSLVDRVVGIPVLDLIHALLSGRLRTNLSSEEGFQSRWTSATDRNALISPFLQDWCFASLPQAGPRPVSGIPRRHANCFRSRIRLFCPFFRASVRASR